MVFAFTASHGLVVLVGLRTRLLWGRLLTGPDRGLCGGSPLYLRKRGIAPRVIRRFLESGLLYEDAVHHNCVFVGRDGSGRARYAGLRGTYDRDGKGFRGDVSGSEKDVGFSMPWPSAGCTTAPCGRTCGSILGFRVSSCAWTPTSGAGRPPANSGRSTAGRATP